MIGRQDISNRSWDIHDFDVSKLWDKNVNAETTAENFKKLNNLKDSWDNVDIRLRRHFYQKSNDLCPSQPFQLLTLLDPHTV